MILSMPELKESELSIISERAQIKGSIFLASTAQIYGQIEGELTSPPGGTLILKETSQVIGQVRGDRIIIDGYVQGEIRASGCVVLSSTARVLGEIIAASLVIEPGAFFEGNSRRY
jgi:cytoskeletal protein CcmA (bactofilin family)